MLTNQSPTLGAKVALILLAAFAPVSALADGADDFNDNNKDTTKWGADVMLDQGVLTEQNQRLEYTCNTSASNDDTLRPWILERFPAGSSWTIQVDSVNATVPTLATHVNSAGIKIVSPHTAGSWLGLELYASSLFGPPTRKGFAVNLSTDGADISTEDSTDLAGTNLVMGAVRMTYDGATKVILCEYDADTTDGYQWTLLASYGLGGAGGSTANTDWSLNGSDQISVWAYEYSGGMVVTSGQLYLDNFVETGGVPSSGGPAPVPTGTWGFGFPVGNPLLTAIASLRGQYTGTLMVGTPRSYVVDVAQDESGKLMGMGTLDGLTDEDGNSDVSGAIGAVKTVDEMPTLQWKNKFNGMLDSDPLSIKTAATIPLEMTDVGGGTNGFTGTGSVSGKLDGVPFKAKNAPLTVPATPDMEANVAKDWTLELTIEQKTVNGKLLTVASAILHRPDGDTVEFPEKKVKYSEQKGYKVSLSIGMFVTMMRPSLAKKTKLKITGLTFQKVDDHYDPTGGFIKYQISGQKGEGDLLDFEQD